MARKNGAVKQAVPEESAPRRNISAYIDAELDLEIRAMIHELRRRIDPDEFNISRFVHESLRANLVRYRKRYNEGRPWGSTQFVRIPSGRPIKKAG